MRILRENAKIDYNETKRFFENRAIKFSEDNPYSVTMYQDNNKTLVRNRNEYELKKLVPLLKLNKDSKVLDVACGIGRWADAIEMDINVYYGLDFSKDLIRIAQKRNRKSNFYFYEEAADHVGKFVQEKDIGKFNVILIVGILMYLNDEEVNLLLKQIDEICEEHAIICIREPIGMEERLTLKDYFSDELQDNYNAIYGTQQEMLKFIKDNFVQTGFDITQQDFLFKEDDLNNRKETRQYYYILER